MFIGRRVYGLGAVVHGIPGLVTGSFAVMGLAVPAHIPGYQPLAYASAALLVLAGLALNVERLAAIVSLVLAGFFALSVLALQAPNAVTAFTTWVTWEGIAEGVVMTLGGVLAFTWTAGVDTARAAAILRIVRPLFGICLMVFGTSEFVYARFTAAMVPAWLPPSQFAWAYVTGAAQIAAGVAILSNIQARLAAMLVTAMYLIFGLIVHLPRVIADPAGAMAWAENGTNLVLAGAAWLLADSLVRAGRSTIQTT